MYRLLYRNDLDDKAVGDIAAEINDTPLTTGKRAWVNSGELTVLADNYIQTQTVVHNTGITLDEDLGCIFVEPDVTLGLDLQLEIDDQGRNVHQDRYDIHDLVCSLNAKMGYDVTDLIKVRNDEVYLAVRCGGLNLENPPTLPSEYHVETKIYSCRLDIKLFYSGRIRVKVTSLNGSDRYLDYETYSTILSRKLPDDSIAVLFSRESVRSMQEATNIICGCRLLKDVIMLQKDCLISVTSRAYGVETYLDKGIAVRATEQQFGKEVYLWSDKLAVEAATGPELYLPISYKTSLKEYSNSECTAVRVVTLDDLQTIKDTLKRNPDLMVCTKGFIVDRLAHFQTNLEIKTGQYILINKNGYVTGRVNDQTIAVSDKTKYNHYYEDEMGDFKW